MACQGVQAGEMPAWICFVRICSSCKGSVANESWYSDRHVTAHDMSFCYVEPDYARTPIRVKCIYKYQLIYKCQRCKVSQRLLSKWPKFGQDGHVMMSHNFPSTAANVPISWLRRTAEHFHPECYSTSRGIHPSAYYSASGEARFSSADGRGVKRSAGESRKMMDTVSSASQLETACSNSVGSLLESVSSFASLTTTSG